jgi:hypothetical protein
MIHVRFFSVIVLIKKRQGATSTLQAYGVGKNKKKGGGDCVFQIEDPTGLTLLCRYGFQVGGNGAIFVGLEFNSVSFSRSFFFILLLDI